MARMIGRNGTDAAPRSKHARSASSQGERNNEAEIGPQHDESVAIAAPRPAGIRLSPGLYLVATPIGNLGDLSRRALQTLASADAIACEDSRVTGNLLRHEGISTELIPYHDHNADRVRPALIRRLSEGAAIALVSDAGTPLISDPGYKLVQEAVAADIPVTAVPGASAVLTALQLSGLPTDRFYFAGFLPPKSGARRRHLRDMAAIPGTLIVFESGGRLVESLADMAAILGDRPGAVARELTKRFEEVRRDGLAALAGHYAAAGAPKGEIVVVIGPATGPVQDDAEDLDARLEEALSTLRLKEAVAQVAADTGLPRKTVYARALILSGKE